MGETIFNKKMSRREALSTGAKIGIAAGIGVAIGAVGGYLGGASTAPPPKTTTTTVTNTFTKTVPGKKIKAGFIYVGPVGDYGWTYAHEMGRQYVASKFPWLETMTEESVPEDQADTVIDRMVSEGADIVFTTSFGYMDSTIKAGEKYPDKVFEHCSGYKRRSNVGTYFAEFYQLYYLCGLAAGAVSETNKVGYIAAFPTPEVIRHINAFVLGARAINPKIKAYVIWLFSWVDPSGARKAAETLVESKGCDVLAFTEDTPATLEVAENYQKKGKKVWSFSHYSDMQHYGPTAHLTGQIVNWGLMYERILADLYSGCWRSKDLWWRIGDGMDYRWSMPVDKSTFDMKLGAVYPAPLNPVIPEEVRALIKRRYEEMKELIFEPFTGPIRDQDGALRVKEGERLGRDELWSMDWFVEGIESKIPS